MEMSQATRRRAYLIGLPLTIAFTLLRMITIFHAPETTSYYFLALPSFLAIQVILFFLVLFKKQLHRISLFLLLAMGSFYWGAILFQPLTGISYRAEMTEIASWVGIFYLISFWFLGTKNGLRFSLIYATLLVTTTIAFNLNRLAVVEERNAILFLAVFSLAIINGLHVLAKTVAIKSKLAWEMTNLAHQDSLTGLPNRLALEDKLKEAFQDQQSLAVFFLDVDGLKNVNDTYGHKAGDSMIVTVANRLKTLLRTHDFVCRVSGDEFVIICPNLSDKANISAVVERIQASLTKPVQLETCTVTVSASIGASLYPHNSQNPEELVRQADAAMYQIKKSGKNGFCFYDDLATEALTEAQLKLEPALT
ncbi:MAG: GGDEF domain-containing protein [Trueperaceae bacterium]|nr:GGDEF domain-containing protein [Trueperaceae bacterium]